MEYPHHLTVWYLYGSSEKYISGVWVCVGQSPCLVYPKESGELEVFRNTVSVANFGNILLGGNVGYIPRFGVRFPHSAENLLYSFPQSYRLGVTDGDLVDRNHSGSKQPIIAAVKDKPYNEELFPYSLYQTDFTVQPEYPPYIGVSHTEDFIGVQSLAKTRAGIELAIWNRIRPL